MISFHKKTQVWNIEEIDFNQDYETQYTNHIFNQSNSTITGVKENEKFTLFSNKNGKLQETQKPWAKKINVVQNLILAFFVFFSLPFYFSKFKVLSLNVETSIIPSG